MEFSFSKRHADLFKQASGDENPMHWDAIYSRRTQFGEPILYGAAGIIKCLAEVSAGDPLDIGHLRISFKKPILVGVSHRVEISRRNNGQIRFALVAGTTECLSGTVTPRGQGVGSALQLHDMGSAADFSSDGLECHVDYGASDEFIREFGIGPPRIPMNQFSAILSASYIVGMKYPGKQALFTALEIAFDRASASPVKWQHIRGYFDKRFSLATLHATGLGVVARLEAIKRPEPVEFKSEDIAAELSDLASLSNKTVFISGTSRGFGNVLAKSFVLKGADVISAYSSFRPGAEELEAIARAQDTKLWNYQLDLDSARACDAMAEELKARNQRIDILVNNASPQITSHAFLDQDSERFLEFVRTSLALVVNPTRALLPLLGDNALVVNISSEWSQSPKANFSHYITAKAAVEGFTRALAAEFPKLRFLTMRAPRMLTDQTNVAIQQVEPLSPVAVGKKLLAAIQSFPPGTNLVEL